MVVADIDLRWFRSGPILLLPGMNSSPILDRTALLIRPRRVVEAANSSALAAGVVIRAPGGFIVDAMLALVYLARSCGNQRKVGDDPSRCKRWVIRSGRLANFKG